MPETRNHFAYGPASETARRVAATANRLRLIQIDFADESPDVRKEYISEEIERSLQDIVPDERSPFLQMLMDRFPTWDANVEVAADEEAPAARSHVDERELQDPSFLVTRLADLAPTLSGPEHRAVSERLVEAGLVPEGEGSLPARAVETLRSALKIGPEDPIDARRALESIALLAIFATSLDQLIWKAWRKMASRSKTRSTSDMQKTIRRFLAGDQDVPRGQVVKDLENLRKIIASLVAAIGPASRQFAKGINSRLSPEAIKEAIKIEGGRSWLTAPEIRYWQRYVELAEVLDEESISKEITDAIARFAISLTEGLGR